MGGNFFSIQFEAQEAVYFADSYRNRGPVNRSGVDIKVAGQDSSTGQLTNPVAPRGEQPRAYPQDLLRVQTCKRLR